MEFYFPTHEAQYATLSFNSQRDGILLKGSRIHER